jgi:hypothetical protein
MASQNITFRVTPPAKLKLPRQMRVYFQSGGRWARAGNAELDADGAMLFMLRCASAEVKRILRVAVDDSMALGAAAPSAVTVSRSQP